MVLLVMMTVTICHDTVDDNAALFVFDHADDVGGNGAFCSGVGDFGFLML